MTYFPPDLPESSAGQYVVAGENIRAEFGTLRAAPGYERVHTKETNLDGPANLIFQPNILATDRESRTTPIIGTDGKLYVVKRRARELVCSDCEVSFAVVGDSGKITPSGDGTVALEEVATMIRSWSPDFVVHTGDLVYGDGGASVDDNPFEAYVGRFFHPFLGGYKGVFGAGPVSNKFFPCMGNHDWTDGPSDRYLSFFFLPSPERYYTFKKGPIQFFVLNSYGYGPASTGPGGTAINGTGAASGVGEADLSWPNSPQAQWLQEQIELSDTAWRVVVFHHPPNTSSANYWPGYAVMDWPWEEMGIDLVLTGHSHVYERIERNGVTRVTCGLGGHSRYNFVTPPVYTPVEDELGFSLTDEHGNPLFAASVPEGPGPFADYVEGSTYRYSADYGALRVVADRGRMIGRFYNRDGDLIDTFTLSAQRVSTVCYITDSARTPVSLEVLPESVTTEVGGLQKLLAYVYYADGSREDVTDRAAWTSDDESVATVSNGVVTGLKAGSTEATATYQGLSDTAEIDVLVQCVDEPLDVLLVLDDSYSMWDSSGTSTRIVRLKEATKLMVDAMANGPGDQLGVMAFNGTFASQLPNTRQLQAVGSPLEACREAIDSLTPSGATGIADAFLQAKEELTAGHLAAGRRKVLVLFTDGFANIVDPDLPTTGNIWTDAMTHATTRANEAKAEGITVMVVALALKYDPTREAIMQSWASDGHYYHADDADELLGVFANLLGDLCRSGYYQTTTPLSVGTELLLA